MSLASTTFHALMNACRSPAGRDLAPEFQAHLSNCCCWTLFFGDPQDTSSPYICHFSDSPSQESNQKLYPLFHPASYQVPGFWLLSFSPTYAFSHLPEALASISLAWLTT